MPLPEVRLLVALLASFVSPVHAQAAPAAPAAETTPKKPAVPRFSRTPVGACGCAIYAPPGFTFDAPTRSEDGADVWTGELATDGGWTFGAVVVKFPEAMPATSSQMEEVLVGYLDFLKAQLSITKAVGVGRGHTHGENAAAKGVIDYWESADGERWAVKGWVDQERLAVLYVRGKGEYPYFSAQQLYLEGFRFKP